MTSVSPDKSTPATRLYPKRMNQLLAIPVQLIEEGRRLREISPAQVEALASSIAGVGLLNPITVYPRKVIQAGISVEGYGLVAGAHRLAAVRRLGLLEINASVVSLSELERQIAECDENLCGTVLSKAERALFTNRRKEAYEALHPEAKAGAVRARAANEAMGHDVDDKLTPTFTQDTASKTGQDIRAVQRDAERGEKVIPEVLDMIRGTKLDTGTYLDKLKKLPPNEQMTAAKRDLVADRREAKAKAKAERKAQQAENDALRDQHREALSPEVKAHHEAKQAAIEKRNRNGSQEDPLIADLPPEDRIAELEEAVAVLEKENADLKAENKLYGEMKVQFEQGGFEKVLADKDEEIRVLETRLYGESADKASWMKSAKYWQAEALKLGWKNGDFTLDPETGEVADV